ncbi:hypothetical protein HNQ07_000418 [Deinococcus metalli]|uniref:Uncharacterized protein n=1 Tax=Deinococcus metalli TaxID=1141878 RepID=A0A7W8NLR3_9DEIO|nr:hypothetical protein [Deinococcus metalli]MBB5374974.1 hypothetical protein [Deinococcus metalli]GHF32355.1 hypothetical protein GCM10017781_06250 [Deinococcus metalli]
MTTATLPAPWAVCEDCGKAAGLPISHVPGVPGAFMCVACYTWHRNVNAATAQLEAMTGPVVGAWAAQWTRAGLSDEDLQSITDSLTGADMAEDFGDAYRARALRYLRRSHRVPATMPEDVPPARETVDPAALPLLAQCRPADPAHGIRARYFIGANGQAYTIHATPDTLTLPQPDGMRLLIFTGWRGVTRFHDRVSGAPGYRVPAHLWADVEAALSGEDEGRPA